MSLWIIRTVSSIHAIIFTTTHLKFSDLGYYRDFEELGYRGVLGHPASVIGVFKILQDKVKYAEKERRLAIEERDELKRSIAQQEYSRERRKENPMDNDLKIQFLDIKKCCDDLQDSRRQLELQHINLQVLCCPIISFDLYPIVSFSIVPSSFGDGIFMKYVYFTVYRDKNCAFWFHSVANLTQPKELELLETVDSNLSLRPSALDPPPRASISSNIPHILSLRTPIPSLSKSSSATGRFFYQGKLSYLICALHRN